MDPNYLNATTTVYTVVDNYSCTSGKGTKSHATPLVKPRWYALTKRTNAWVNVYQHGLSSDATRFFTRSSFLRCKNNWRSLYVFQCMPHVKIRDLAIFFSDQWRCRCEVCQGVDRYNWKGRSAGLAIGQLDGLTISRDRPHRPFQIQLSYTPDVSSFICWYCYELYATQLIHWLAPMACSLSVALAYVRNSSHSWFATDTKARTVKWQVPLANARSFDPRSEQPAFHP